MILLHNTFLVCYSGKYNGKENPKDKYLEHDMKLGCFQRPEAVRAWGSGSKVFRVLGLGFRVLKVSGVVFRCLGV